MLRECTDYENKILKESKGSILTYPQLYAETMKRSILPYLLGGVLGLGLAAALLWRLPDLDFTKRALIVVFCVGVPVSLFEAIREWRFKRKSRKAPLPGNKFRVNGGMILGYGVNHMDGKTHLVIAEDDLLDAEGNQICIEYPAPMRLSITQGQRVLLAYNEKGAYIPLRLTAKTNSMIPLASPDCFQTMDWEKTTRLPHPSVLELDQKSCPLQENEAEDLIRACNRYTDYWIRKKISGRTAKKIRKLQYKKKVMYLTTYREYGFNEVYIAYIRVLEYIDGTLRMRRYFISDSVFLPKDIPYGKVIYKYSQKEEGRVEDLNFFTQLDD